MSEASESRYGPCWQLVRDFIAQIPDGFVFDSVGRRHPDDALVTRIYDWPTLRRLVNYGFPDAGPHNCPYLRFLTTVHGAAEANRECERRHGLAQAVEHAVNDASDEFLARGADWKDEKLTELLSSAAYEEPYPFCTFSFQDHCAYIVSELVVAHTTSVHLLRDMWHWYRAGHWPCGWEGEWPTGRLIVF